MLFCCIEPAKLLIAQRPIMESAATRISNLGRAAVDFGYGRLWIGLPLVVLLSLGIFLRQRDPLKHYPGPFLASKPTFLCVVNLAN
jgi:hypothetical protein